MISQNQQLVIDLILKFLGSPETPWQVQALTYFEVNNITAIRLLALNQLGDPYCQSLAILIDVKFQSTNLTYILNSCASAVSECLYQNKLKTLGGEISDALNSNYPIDSTNKIIQDMLIPETFHESASFNAFVTGDYSTLRYWAGVDSKNPFIKTLSQLCHVHADNPNLVVILIKATRNVAQHYRARKMRELRSLIKKTLD